MEGQPLGFVDPAKGPEHYVRRYLNEPSYRSWFERNYPDHTIYGGLGISREEYDRIVSKLGGSGDGGLERLQRLAERVREEEGSGEGQDLARSVLGYGQEAGRSTFEEFVDERALVSRDLFGKKEMKIKVLEVSDEIQESKIRWKFGDRVKVDRILVTIKHLDTMKVEEGEFDIKAIEAELAKERHWSSTNRWIPAGDIKNGYVVNSKHTALISDAVALDYIVF